MIRKDRVFSILRKIMNKKKWSYRDINQVLE
jgi:hypothetical protein